MIRSLKVGERMWNAPLDHGRRQRSAMSTTHIAIAEGRRIDHERLSSQDRLTVDFILQSFYTRDSGDLQCLYPGCKKRYVSVAKVRDHARSHFNFILKCPYCHQCRKYLSALQRHVLERHNTTPYKCDFCGLFFWYGPSFFAHRAEKKCEQAKKAAVKDATVVSGGVCGANKSVDNAPASSEIANVSTGLQQYSQTILPLELRTQIQANKRNCDSLSVNCHERVNGGDYSSGQSKRRPLLGDTGRENSISRSLRSNPNDTSLLLQSLGTRTISETNPRSPAYTERRILRGQPSGEKLHSFTSTAGYFDRHSRIPPQAAPEKRGLSEIGGGGGNASEQKRRKLDDRLFGKLFREFAESKMCIRQEFPPTVYYNSAGPPQFIISDLKPVDARWRKPPDLLGRGSGLHDIERSSSRLPSEPGNIELPWED